MKNSEPPYKKFEKTLRNSKIVKN